MNIDGIYADPQTYQPDAKGSQELDKDAFMTLLVAQLKNQDPIEPKDNSEYVAQLANFSSLEQMSQMNENITTMALLQQSNALLSSLSESSGLIGHEVSWADEEIGTSGTGTVQSVRIKDGLTLLQVDGADVPLYTVTEVHGESTTDAATSDGTSTDATDTADDQA